MIIKTDFEKLEAELLEESKFFDAPEDLEAVHTHAYENGKFINKITVGGKEYGFENSHPYRDETEFLRYEKRYAKLSLYNALSDYLGVSLPWGALTGIRPVKFAYNEGDEWRKVMRDEMHVSEKKLDMVSRIIDSQKGVYDKTEGNCDLFISVPFCPSRCLYCSFVSNEIGKEKRLEEYVYALCREIRAALPLIKNLRSVYIGGGTPVSLPLDLLERILQTVGKVDCEYTVEAGRPDCIDDATLTLLKEYGVTRVCVNPQSFSDKTLALIGRKHSAKDVIDKFALAKKYGFIVNTDLIAGLTGETFEDFKRSIDIAARLSPENITVHTLSLKKGSILKESCERLNAGDIEKMVDYAAETLISNGYAPYYTYRQKYMAGNLENTGYTKSGYACVYNVDVMEEIADNLACGANGVSKKLFDGGERIERYGAPKDIKTYIDKIDEIISRKNKLFANGR